MSRKRTDTVGRGSVAREPSRDQTVSPDTGLDDAVPMQARLMLSLQRRVGNRAVSGLMQRRHERLGPPAGQSTKSPAPMLAKARTREPERSPRSVKVSKQTSPGVLQRYTITSGWFKKAVEFKLDALQATFDNPALSVRDDSGSLNVGSAPFRVQGTVTATGLPAEVGKYELGFVQTLFRNSVRFRYKNLSHHRTIGDRILPMVLGKNMRITTTSGLLPVKDGDNYVSGGNKADKLYYEKKKTVSFASANASQKTTKLYDRPNSSEAWAYSYKGQDVHLIGTSGLDSFRTWLVIRKKSWSSTAYRRLGYVDWTVNYKSTVTPDQANPENGAVAPGGSSGGRVSSPVKGVGVYLPVTGAESANTSLEDHVSNW